MPAASGASPPATPPAAASGMCGGAPCCVAAAGSDVAAAGAGPGSVAARAKKWSAARAAQRTGASSRCGAQYGEFALRPARALSLASRLRWLLKSFLSVRFSCFSSKRPNSAAMTDLGGFPALPFFGLAVVSQFGARDGLRPKENAESNVFSHTTQTQTLRSPQLPRWQGDASPDGVRWWGPATQL